MLRKYIKLHSLPTMCVCVLCTALGERGIPIRSSHPMISAYEKEFRLTVDAGREEEANGVLVTAPSKPPLSDLVYFFQEATAN